MVDYFKRPLYLHFKYQEQFDSEEEAREWGKFYQSIIDTLSTKHPVYVRRNVTIGKERLFEEDKTVWLAAARFSVGDCGKSGKQAGIILPSPHFDDGSVLYGFDFPFVKKSPD